MSATRDVMLLNADYTSLGRVEWKKAVLMVIKGKAVVEDYDFESGRRLREWPFPERVRLSKFAVVNYRKLYGEPLFSKSGVLKRDKYLCCYCGGAAKTIDHVLPRSRNGANTYLNTVAACFSCNNKKDNKTPEEARMPMKWKPYMPTKMQLMGR